MGPTISPLPCPVLRMSKRNFWPTNAGPSVRAARHTPSPPSFSASRCRAGGLPKGPACSGDVALALQQLSCLVSRARENSSRRYRWFFVTKFLLTFYCESLWSWKSFGCVIRNRFSWTTWHRGDCFAPQEYIFLLAVGSSPGHCTVSSRLDTRWPDDSLGSNTLPMFASSQLGIQLGSCLLALGNGWIIVWINDEITWAQINCTLPGTGIQSKKRSGPGRKLLEQYTWHLCLSHGVYH